MQTSPPLRLIPSPPINSDPFSELHITNLLLAAKSYLSTKLWTGGFLLKIWKNGHDSLVLLLLDLMISGLPPSYHGDYFTEHQQPHSDLVPTTSTIFRLFLAPKYSNKPLFSCIFFHLFFTKGTSRYTEL